MRFVLKTTSVQTADEYARMIILHKTRNFTQAGSG